uniref:Uncharacterized protein n=1 Tax=Solanum tuberosum TaxID=4113 RepID=M1DMX8_SOLTU
MVAWNSNSSILSPCMPSYRDGCRCSGMGPTVAGQTRLKSEIRPQKRFILHFCTLRAKERPQGFLDIFPPFLSLKTSARWLLSVIGFKGESVPSGCHGSFLFKSTLFGIRLFV